MRPALFLLKKATALFLFCLLAMSSLFAQPRIAPFAYPSSTPINYIRSWDVVAPESNPNNLMLSTPLDKAVMTTQYLDGLGRPIQTVVKGITPLGKDLVTPVVYDAYGREDVRYLPFASVLLPGA